MKPMRNMLKIALLFVCFSHVFSQRSHRREQPIPLEEEEEEPLYRPMTRDRRGDTFNPASVHYVNIGAKLEGDYKFGYDTGKREDGQSFREETRLPDGSVKGAYGYVDSDGKQRIVKYTAGKDGYKVEGDSAAPRTAPVPAQAQRPAPRQEYPRAMPQPEYQPPAPQQQYPAPRRQAYAPQPSYQSVEPRPHQNHYDSGRDYVPSNAIAQRPPVQAAPRMNQVSRQAPAAYRPQPSYRDDSDDYNDDGLVDELPDRRVNVPIDTRLFNYNIGVNRQSRK